VGALMPSSVNDVPERLLALRERVVMDAPRVLRG
jgi:hypothetical protein